MIFQLTLTRLTPWWRRHAVELPLWASACKSVLLVQPSSAAAEQFFSLLSNPFKEQQADALEDSSIMVQYNRKKD